MKTENHSLMNEECLSWDECFILDIEIIDNQHLNQFDIFKKILNVRECNYNYENMLFFLDELEKQSTIHFKTEESLMLVAEYDEIELHNTQHLYFLQQLQNFKNTFKYCNSKLIEQLHEFVRKWILNHIYVEDVKYAQTVKSYIIREIDNWVI
ncbi:MAG: hemerythrin family protein [Paludibacter sp.]|nr:hemerythrin family protein [Paludibacter sp.]